MRKGMWSVAAVIVLLTGAGAVLTGTGALAADTQVKIVEGNASDINTWKFEPAEITVTAGSTVTWRNDGKLDHTATADNKAFDSGNLSPGKDFKFTFSTPGEFTYNCTPHPFMTGVVKVTGGSPTTAAPTPTTAAPPGGATTTTTAKGAQASSTTTTKPGAAGGTTTTTAGLGVTSTTQAASTTPTSAPETGDVTSTTMAAGTDGQGGEESAAETRGSEGGSDKETNPVAVGLAGILTALLTAISLKLLTGKP